MKRISGIPLRAGNTRSVVRQSIIGGWLTVEGGTWLGKWWFESRLRVVISRVGSSLSWMTSVSWQRATPLPWRWPTQPHQKHYLSAANTIHNYAILQEIQSLHTPQPCLFHRLNKHRIRYLEKYWNNGESDS